MSTNKIEEIVTILKTNDTNAVPFAKTKDEILSKGFTEAELVLALYSFPYDGKPNQQKQENKMREFYEKHPEKANENAKLMLKTLAQQDLDKATAYGMASQFGTTQSKLYYESRFADEIGFPYFRFTLAAVVLIGLGYKFGFMNKVYWLVSIVATFWMIYLYAKKVRAAK